VRLDLHQDVREVAPVAPGAVRIGKEARDLGALHHRGVVGVRDDRSRGVLRVRVADHLEERVVLLLAVDGPGRVEDLVAAMLGVGLREHHELDVRGIATQPREALQQVVDLVGGEREAERGVGLLERAASALRERDRGERLRRGVREEPRGLRHVVDHHFGHAIVDHAIERTPRALRKGTGIARGDRVGDAALDARDLRESTVPAMSVAFEDHGDTVPKRGSTSSNAPSGGSPAGGVP
jgi:hypothetical protein